MNEELTSRAIWTEEQQSSSKFDLPDQIEKLMRRSFLEKGAHDIEIIRGEFKMKGTARQGEGARHLLKKIEGLRAIIQGDEAAPK